ncbi:MAG: NAD(P)/FAD-dependent oxidoreductase [Candidatus Pacebacteria bacterium]|nr:NAD(P)/FAD-dependent oxidoreductase [Candidatus Paceibacterota bacterium]
MKKTVNRDFEVAVIGGGPAGLMAAGRSAEVGAKTILIEKNLDLGRKLLLTGRERCNLTHAEFNLKEFVKAYGKEGQFLLSPLSFFGPRETIDFFEKRGVRTKVERGKRVFPESDKASDVLDVLIKYFKEGKVKIQSGLRVEKIFSSGRRVTGVQLKDGRRISAKNYIICTGGKSFPGTGSTGDGFFWAKSLGHSVISPRPSLVPLQIKESWPKSVQGLSLKNVKLTVFLNGKKEEDRTGEALFTHFGISGPIVLDMSKKIGAILEKGEVKLELDLKPGLTEEELDSRLQRDFKKFQRKQFKNALSDLLPLKLIPIVINFSQIDPEKSVNCITKEERRALINVLKGMKMTVSGLLDFESAIATSGGVSLKEIDSRTMKSKIIENLFFAGEIIDLDGPSGGYNLQNCWTTGYVAGQSAAKNI